MRKLNRLLALVLALVLAAALLTGCAHGRTDMEGEAVFQVSTIDALLEGGYDGQVSVAELLTQGDHGLGTFHALDGEMVVVDGVAYQVRVDGRAYLAPPDAATPFAAVARLPQGERLVLSGPLDLAGLQEALDRALPAGNVFCLVRVDGVFQAVKARSVPAQTRPYPLLVDVVKTGQAVFELGRVEGTLVGLRSPAMAKGLNVTGWHFHFLDADRTRGGHVLEVKLEQGQVRLAGYRRLAMVLPAEETGAAGQAQRDKSSELKTVEQGR